MKKMSIIPFFLILLLFPACTGKSATTPFSRLDINGNYTGFTDLPMNYTPEQAEKDGCYVLVDSETAVGEQNWKDFVKKASKGEDSNLRIVNITKNEIYFSDLFYENGYYRVFKSTSEDLKDHKFRYLLTLEGTLRNAATSGSVTILTDDKSLTYDDVMWTFLSSDTRYIKSIPPFKLLF